MKTVCDGIWVPMLTPFSSRDNKIDYVAIKALLDFYAYHKINGIFVNCQSNEIFQLSTKERLELATFVTENRPHSLDVVIGASACNYLEGQISEIRALSSLPASSYVLITSLLAKADEPDDVLYQNLMNILDTFPDLPFGLYECPQPYKRLLSTDFLKLCVKTERINFMKLTSCNSIQIIEKINTVRGTSIKLFNANTATFLDSIYGGINGYCGPMCNFHPDLYVQYWDMAKTQKEEAELFHQILSVFSLVIYQCWPVSAKYYLQLEGVPVQCTSRMQDENSLNFSKKKELEALYDVTKRLREDIKKKYVKEE